MKEIRVIGSDIDGAELRRERAEHPNHIRCESSADHPDEYRAKTPAKAWTIPADGWDRIFGRSD